jgi:hypothetical protein
MFVASSRLEPLPLDAAPKKNPPLILAEMGFWILLCSAKYQPTAPSFKDSHHQLLIV